MATIRQKRAKEIMNRAETKSYKEAMIKAGYDETTALHPSSNLIDRPSFKELEQAEKSQEDEYCVPLDGKNKITVALNKLFKELDNGDLSKKEALMLVKVSADVMKQHPEWFVERELTKDDALKILQDRQRHKDDHE